MTPKRYLLSFFYFEQKNHRTRSNIKGQLLEVIQNFFFNEWNQMKDLPQGQRWIDKDRFVNFRSNGQTHGWNMRILDWITSNTFYQTLIGEISVIKKVATIKFSTFEMQRFSIIKNLLLTIPDLKLFYFKANVAYLNSNGQSNNTVKRSEEKAYGSRNIDM